MANLRYVKGLDEFQKALEQFPKNIARNVLRGAVSAGATVIQKEAIHLAPEYEGEDPRAERGRLKANIFRKQAREASNEMVQTYIVGVKSGKESGKYKIVVNGKVTYLDAYYWWWVENGHFYVPPGLVSGKGSSVPNKKHREAARARAVWIAPRSFLRPAFAIAKDEALNTMIRYFERGIPREAAKLGLVMK